MTIQAAMQILEISAPFSKEVLKKAYRDALMVWHPDRFAGNTELKAKAEARTCQIYAAYELLNGLPESRHSHQNTDSAQQTPSSRQQHQAASAPTHSFPSPAASQFSQPSPSTNPSKSSVGTGSPASFWARILAFYIDLIVPYAAFNAFTLTNLFGDESDAWVVGSSVACAWFYNALMESSPAQATLGKLLLGLKVTDDEGMRIGFARASFRFFGKFLSMSLRASSVWSIWSSTRQFYHDYLTLSRVVRRK